MLRTKVPNDNDAILSPFNLQVYKNGGFQIEVCRAVWKSNANKPSPLWYLNCFLFDNPIIVSRAVSIALAISSWTNHSRNLKHFRFDSAIFWQFKAIRGGLTRIGIDFVFLLIMLIPWKSVFSSFCLIIAVRKTENCRRSNRAVIGTCYCPVLILKCGDMIFPKHPRASILVSMQTKKPIKNIILPDDSPKVMIKVIARFTQERKYDLKVANPSLSHCSNSYGLFLTDLSRRAALNNPQKLKKWYGTRTYEILSAELLALASLICC